MVNTTEDTFSRINFIITFFYLTNFLIISFYVVIILIGNKINAYNYIMLYEKRITKIFSIKNILLKK